MMLNYTVAAATPNYNITFLLDVVLVESLLRRS